MIIGIDFDNTIVNYDGVFYKAARLKGLIPRHIGTTKDSVRNYLRSIGKEDAWTLLQGFIYGSRMDLATPYEGVENFLRICPHPLFIISHKTVHPFLGPQYNLHASAATWLKNLPFPTPPAYFEPTLAEKLERIRTQQCTHFIDDLPEIFLEEKFPSHVKKVLFDPANHHPDSPHYTRVTSWKQCSAFLLNQ